MAQYFTSSALSLLSSSPSSSSMAAPGFFFGSTAFTSALLPSLATFSAEPSDTDVNAYDQAIATADFQNDRSRNDGTCQQQRCSSIAEDPHPQSHHRRRLSTITEETHEQVAEAKRRPSLGKRRVSLGKSGWAVAKGETTSLEVEREVQAHISSPPRSPAVEDADVVVEMASGISGEN